MQTTHMWFVRVYLLFFDELLFISTYYQELVQIKPGPVGLITRVDIF
jgi:hypothetical protein